MRSGNPSVEILLPNHLGHGFDYAVPEGMELAPGDYVIAPFGSRELPGVVWGAGNFRGQQSKIALSSASCEEQHVPQRRQLKKVHTKQDHLPPLTQAMREFIDWAAWYTCSPKGALLRMVLPVHDAVKPPSSRERSSLSTEVGVPQHVALGGAQADAAAALKRSLSEGFSVTLLDGVTGSGKTEVYFDAIEKLVAEEKQALVLLPEISLSVQWLERFAKRFGFAPHVWHSGLPPGRRKHTWRAIADGSARVVVGARSALFLPYKNLSLVVVDEEHDGSYKQEEGVVYHARDLGVARARFEKIPALLVSATPSIETLNNAQQGKYRTLHLPVRHGGAAMPEVQIIDMRTAPLERGAFLSGTLRAELAAALARGHQSVLFLNRRGYAPLVLCRACGHRFQCPQCTAWLVLHKGKSGRGTMRCHHCDYHIAAMDKCPACQGEDTLHACGPGVERIAEEVGAFLPQARIHVLTSDSAENYAGLQDTILAMQQGAIDIMIGTQILAKGHHFAGLALVGVVDADLGLGGGDLRAGERTYQLLHQLSGRAGREKIEGKVMLQSFAPTHPVMQALINGERDAFMALELSERERAGMPPFSRLAALIVDGMREEQVAAHARMLAKSAPRHAMVEVLGPAPAPLYLLRGRYRQRLLVKADRKLNLQAYITDWLGAAKPPGNLRVKVDIDPYSFF